MEQGRSRAELERLGFGRDTAPDERAEALRALAAPSDAEAPARPVDAPDEGDQSTAERPTASQAFTDSDDSGSVAPRRLPRALLIGAAVIALLLGVGVGWAARGGGADSVAAPGASPTASDQARIDIEAQSVVLRCFTAPGTKVAASVVFADYTAASDAYRDPPGACTDLIPVNIDRMAIADRIRSVVDAGARCGSIAQMLTTGEDVTYFAAADGTTRISHDPALISGLRCETEIVLNADPPTFQRSITCRSAQGIDVVGGTSDFGDCPSP